MVSKKLFSAVLATLMIVSILGSTVVFAQTETATMTANATKNATTNATTNVTKKVTTGAVASVASAAASAAGGFLGLPGFEALYAVVGLLAVAYLVIRRRK
ncbi:MAG: PGF-CTERM sorting domain-containing protein [Halobacteriota archaeon]